MPLPLVPFEEYMLRDDKPAHPMSTYIRLRLSGRLDRTAAEQAYQTTAARHPLLQSTVRAVGRRLEWVPFEGPLPPMQWCQGPRCGPFPLLRPIDLWREPALKVWGVENPEGPVVVFQMHHAACDGMGVFQVVEDFLVAYALARGEKSPRVALRPLEPQRLADRGKFGLTAGKLLRMAPKQAVGLLGVRQFFMRRPVPVLPSATPASAPLPAEYPTVRTVRFPGSEALALRGLAKRNGATLNDWLIRDLFLAMTEFRRKHHPTGAGDWLRFSIPMNLRNAADRFLPAANVVSMVFLDRRGADFDDPQRLLRGVHDEMQRIKECKLGFTFLGSLHLLRALPGGIARVVAGEQCTATCVLTNLGNALDRIPLPKENGRFVAGDVVLEDFDLMAPLRYGTALVMAIYLYADGLYASMHYDCRQLPSPLAAELQDLFMQQLHRSAAAQP